MAGNRGVGKGAGRGSPTRNGALSLGEPLLRVRISETDPAWKRIQEQREQAERAAWAAEAARQAAVWDAAEYQSRKMQAALEERHPMIEPEQGWRWTGASARKGVRVGRVTGADQADRGLLLRWDLVWIQPHLPGGLLPQPLLRGAILRHWRLQPDLPLALLPTADSRATRVPYLQALTRDPLIDSSGSRWKVGSLEMDPRVARWLWWWGMVEPAHPHEAEGVDAPLMRLSDLGRAVAGHASVLLWKHNRGVTDPSFVVDRS